MHQLEKLRANLQHFELSPDFGDSEAVAAIRLLLKLRIREAENAENCRSSLQPEPQTEAA